MKKRFLSLLLVGFLLIGLTACGNTGSNESQAPESSASTEPSTPSDDVPSDGYDTDSWSPITLRLANGLSETDLVSKSLVDFCDYVEEKSDGKITFELNLGGTFCATTEEFDYLSEGVIDVAAILVAPAASKVPMWNILAPSSSVEDSLALANYLVFENPETSAVLIGQYEANNAVPLAYATSGNTLYVSTSDWSTWSDLYDRTYGTALSADIFASLGLNVQIAQLTDQYESLSRGIIDACGAGLIAIYSNKLYEVAPYAVLSGCANSSNILSFNLDTWNGLSEDQQALIREAAAHYTEYNLEQYAVIAKEYVAQMEAAGTVVKEMSAEDDEFYLRTAYPASYASYLSFAENLDCVDDYNMIADALSQWHGFDIRTGEDLAS